MSNITPLNVNRTSTLSTITSNPTQNRTNPLGFHPQFGLPNFTNLIQLLIQILQQIQTNQNQPAKPITGKWGSEADDVALTMNPDGSGGNLQYGCSTGTIGAIKPDANGNFTTTGTERFIGGIPRRDEVTGEIIPYPTVNVTYKGKVQGNTMTLSIYQDSNQALLRTVTLQLGVEPTIEMCP